jgi:hypothetical protein
MCDICDVEFHFTKLICDYCHLEFDLNDQPKESFQTYNAEWFCSVTCGRNAGWT